MNRHDLSWWALFGAAAVFAASLAFTVQWLAHVMSIPDLVSWACIIAAGVLVAGFGWSLWRLKRPMPWRGNR